MANNTSENNENSCNCNGVCKTNRNAHKSSVRALSLAAVGLASLSLLVSCGTAVSGIAEKAFERGMHHGQHMNGYYGGPVYGYGYDSIQVAPDYPMSNDMKTPESMMDNMQDEMNGEFGGSIDSAPSVPNAGNK